MNTCQTVVGKRHGPYRVHKEGFEVLGLGTQLRRPGDLPFKDFVDGIHVVEVWALGEEQLSPSGKQTLRQSSSLRRAANQQSGLGDGGEGKQTTKDDPLTFRLSTGPIFRIRLFSTNWCLC